MIDYNNAEEAQKQLVSALNYFEQTKTVFKYSDTKHQIYSRRNQTSILARHLDAL